MSGDTPEQYTRDGRVLTGPGAELARARDRSAMGAPDEEQLTRLIVQARWEQRHAEADQLEQQLLRLRLAAPPAATAIQRQGSGDAYFDAARHYAEVDAREAASRRPRPPSPFAPTEQEAHAMVQAQITDRRWAR